MNKKQGNCKPYLNKIVTSCNRFVNIMASNFKRAIRFKAYRKSKRKSDNCWLNTGEKIMLLIYLDLQLKIKLVRLVGKAQCLTRVAPAESRIVIPLLKYQDPGLRRDDGKLLFVYTGQKIAKSM